MLRAVVVASVVFFFPLSAEAGKFFYADEGSRFPLSQNEQQLVASQVALKAFNVSLFTAFNGASTLGVMFDMAQTLVVDDRTISIAFSVERHVSAIFFGQSVKVPPTEWARIRAFAEQRLKAGERPAAVAIELVELCDKATRGWRMQPVAQSAEVGWSFWGLAGQLACLMGVGVSGGLGIRAIRRIWSE